MLKGNSAVQCSAVRVCAAAAATMIVSKVTALVHRHMSVYVTLAGQLRIALSTVDVITTARVCRAYTSVTSVFIGLLASHVITVNLAAMAVQHCLLSVSRCYCYLFVQFCLLCVCVCVSVCKDNYN